MGKQIVIGLGTGRCGTLSLAKLLNLQEKSNVTHEAKPLIPWDKRQVEGYKYHIEKFKTDNKSLVGDVAFYWLPYIDDLCNEFPNIKIIGLWRDRTEVVKSFMKKTEGLNHWMYHRGIEWTQNIFDFCFPKYEASTKGEALGLYWDEYQKTLKQEVKKRPDNVLMLHMDELNTEEGQDKIFDFLGLKEHEHLLPCKFNAAKNVWVSILNQGVIRPELSNVLLRMSSDGRYSLHFNYPNRRPEMFNRNIIVNEFLDSGYEYLLMIDADVVPKSNPLNLVELDKDIINFAVPQWTDGDMYWVAMDKVDDGWKALPVNRRKGLQEVDATGCAVLLVHRRVFEKMKQPYFEEKYDEKMTNVISLDYDFCEKAKKIGFKVWVHFDYFASHFKELDLLDVFKLLGKANG